MAYAMRFRGCVYLLADGDVEASALDTPLLCIGDFILDNPAQGEVILSSLSAVYSACSSLVRRIQSSFLKNARLSISGKPVGAPEAGQPDLDADVKVEKNYVIADTPNPKLVYQMRRANRKPPTQAVNTAFVPVDATPEVDQLL